ncbi:MAG: molybdate transport system substrate-binding protein [Oleiphilaceae bacterium]|jgi:molybdate transport system substrate-binding protein
MRRANKQILCFLVISLISCCSFADQVRIAVAGNFYQPLKLISAQFSQLSGHELQVSVGSTGKLYAQIINGAPFDVLISADQIRPTKLAAQQLAIKKTQFTYAIGKLVLWSRDQSLIDNQGMHLKTGTLKHLAIANPKIAPYGEQAVNVLKNMGIYQQLASKLILGQSVGQTFQHLSTGSVQQGILALSQVMQDGTISSGSGWIIPDALYQPIQQDAILLNKGKNNAAAIAFLAYLKNPQSEKVIRSFGYQAGS